MVVAVEAFALPAVVALLLVMAVMLGLFALWGV
jgi:hypothetical protein